MKEFRRANFGESQKRSLQRRAIPLRVPYMIHVPAQPSLDYLGMRNCLLRFEIAAANVNVTHEALNAHGRPNQIPYIVSLQKNFLVNLLKSQAFPRRSQRHLLLTTAHSINIIGTEVKPLALVPQSAPGANVRSSERAKGRRTKVNF